ncbi:hypothetical protein BH11PAT4_BH11PAT4_8930 [soil metagenome]
MPLPGGGVNNSSSQLLSGFPVKGVPPGLLSRQEKYLLLERAILAYYHWYCERSQATRNWHPNTSVTWGEMRQDHSDEVITILRGFYAVEFYVPDYVSTLLKHIRQSRGRSHFHLRWGAEEAKHSDLWMNTLLFSGRYSLKELEDYSAELAANSYELPWEDAAMMLTYTVFQERATQVNYLGLRKIADGKSEVGTYAGAADPVLSSACRFIATDEAAHYNFFLQLLKLHLYYFPAETVESIVKVIRHFTMPAGDIIPGYDHFSKVVSKAAVYGPRQHTKDVIRVVLDQLGIESVKDLEGGIKRLRVVPDMDGNFRETAIFEGLAFDDGRPQLFGSIEKHEDSYGLPQAFRTTFVPNY